MTSSKPAPSETPVTPYGAWPSPISAAEVAAGELRLSFPRLVGDEVWWTEGRSEEGGRQVVVRRRVDGGGAAVDVLPAPWNARSRVHEYGGASWTAAQSSAQTGASTGAQPGADATLVFVNFADQRMYALPLGAAEPLALTPEPATPAALRYAELQQVGSEIWAIRESHDNDTVTRHLVAVPLDASMRVREIVGGSDFLASARISPDGRRVAWIAWNHPRMPWDGTELRVAELGTDGTARGARTVLGGPTESVLQPEWAGDDALYAVSDRSGWWNLYRLSLDGPSEPEPLCPREEEFGAPLWQLGYRTYGLLADGRLAVLHGRGRSVLATLDPSSGKLDDLDPAWTSWDADLDVAGSRVAGIAASGTEPESLVVVDLAVGSATVARSSIANPPDPAYLPRPNARTLPGPHGREVHAVVYPPANPDVVAPDGELPPYVVHVHGGPTAHSVPMLRLDFAYLTSRGIGVVDVNYGGSTGYGREYRERLRRQWGIVDVEDCVAAGLALAESGEADRARLIIQGGSAGGWTTLAALTSTDVFAAGTSYYGVAELLRFVEDTHDFESRYLDGLIGTLPEDQEVYVQRAPLSHVDDVSCPVLLLQGLDDEVVPASQSEMFRDALVRKGIPHAYLAFEGEEHGFRRAETIVTCLEAELSFYGQVLGFEPPGVPRLKLA